jgi:Helix-turn-helix domain
MKETVRKTYKEKLRPTPAQERQLERVLWRCRTLYNMALEQRSWSNAACCGNSAASPARATSRKPN